MKQKQSAAETNTGLSFETRLCGTANVVTNTYQHGGKLSVELVAENGEPIAMLSVNMPECSHLLSDGEFSQRRGVKIRLLPKTRLRRESSATQGAEVTTL